MTRSKTSTLSAWCITLMVCAFSVAVSAQGLINNGASIVINNNPTVYINGSTGNYTSQSGGIFTNITSNGTIVLGGNWINQSANGGFSSDGTTVKFIGSSAQSIEGSSSSAFFNLLFSGGSTKTVNAPSSVKKLVTVDAATTLNANGNLTLLAIDTTSNANIGPLLSGASVIGNVNVQSFITGGSLSNRGNRIFSSPLNDAALGSNNSYKQLQSYMLITGPGNTTNGFDRGNNNSPDATTIYQYNESASRASSSQFTFTQTIGENLAPARGTLLFYRGDRSNPTAKLNVPYATPESQTITLSGPVNQGTYTVNLSYTNHPGEEDINGYNLAGNPYPSVIDWTKVLKDTSLVQDFIMFIKPGGGYATYLNGFSTNSNNKDLRYIQPGQGFYVRAKATGGSLTFTEECKETGVYTVARQMYKSNDHLGFSSAPAFAKSTAPTVKSSLKSLKLSLKDELNTEEAVAVFQNGKNSTAGSDDAAFFGGSTISLSTLSSDSKRLAINFMPDVTASQELKIHVDAGASKNVKLEVKDLRSLENYQVLLQDSYTNQVIDIKNQSSYSFSINKSDAASYGGNRLKLLFQPPTTLPVKLLSFKARKAEKGAELIWQTAKEGNNSFEIERSEDGMKFAGIGKVKDASGSSATSSNYSFTDENPYPGINYYRLKTFDEDGKSAYSGVATLNYTLGKEAISVYPNPTTEKISVNLPSRNMALTLTVTDLLGRELKKRTVAKSEPLEMNVADLKAGVYILQIFDLTNEKIGSAKFIRE